MIDADAGTHKLSATLWQRFDRRLKVHEGWADSLQADFGHELIRFLGESEILDRGVTSLAEVKDVLNELRDVGIQPVAVRRGHQPRGG